jgi:regulator of protease activity HflC (stomatin/prohibitin superfamily)
MNTIGWIILVILVVPAIGIFLWVLLSESFIRIPSGGLGLLLVRGRPTERTFGPGVHFVPAIRRRMVVVYPSVELTYRAGGEAEPVDQPGLDTWGPAVEVFLGDRARVLISYSVRFQLIPESLRTVHVRFGPGGLSGIVRDETAALVIRELGGDEVSVDDLFGPAREQLQARVAEQLTDRLHEDGFELVSFRIRSIDLGRTGDAIQSAARARHEQAAENATAATRAAQLANDQELAEQAPDDDDAPWRYRETELWRELVQRRETLNVTLTGVSQQQLTGFGPATPDAPPNDSKTDVGSGESR